MPFRSRNGALRVVFYVLIACVVWSARGGQVSTGYNEAVARLRAGDFAGSCSLAGKIAREHPNFYAIYNLLGLCAANRGDDAEAESFFRKSIALNPGFADSRNNLAIHLLKRGKQHAAIEQFHEVLKISPQDITALCNLGKLEFMTGDKQALLHLGRAAELAPQDRQISLALAEALESSGQYQEERDLLSSFAPPPDHAAEWHALLGYASYKLGDPRQAEINLRRALELSPKTEKYWMHMGEMLVFYNSYEAAAAFFETGIKEIPGSAALRVGLAVAYLSAGKPFEIGLQQLEAALKLAPDFEPAFAALCRAHYGQKNWSVLRDTARRWIERNPKAAQPYYYQAVELLESGAAKGLPEALRLLRKSISLDPEFYESRLAIGKLLIQQEQIPDAIKQFTRATAIKPDAGAAYYQLALAYKKAGQAEESRAAMEKFTELKDRDEPWGIVFQLSK